MIDPELVDRMTPDYQKELKVALGIVFITGILDAQMDKLKTDLLIGDDESPVEELASRILTMRKRVNALSELKDVCKAYYQEMNHNA